MAIVSVFNLPNWFFSVADNSPATHVFSTALGAFTVNSATAFATWLSSGQVSTAAGAVNSMANNGSGLIRVAVQTTSKLVTGSMVNISSALGTIEANGNWAVTVIDSTHIDLQGSSFVNPYTGGAILTGATPIDDVSSIYKLIDNYNRQQINTGIYSGFNNQSVSGGANLSLANPMVDVQYNDIEGGGHLILPQANLCGSLPTGSPLFITPPASGYDVYLNDGTTKLVTVSANMTTMIVMTSNASTNGSWHVMMVSPEAGLPVSQLSPPDVQQACNIGSLRYKAAAVPFDTVGDTPITIALPTGTTRYRIVQVEIGNANGDISAATVGLFTAASGGGVAIIPASTAVTVTASAADTNNNVQVLEPSTALTQAYNDLTLYFRVGAGAVTGRTADVIVRVVPF